MLYHFMAFKGTMMMNNWLWDLPKLRLVDIRQCRRGRACAPVSGQLCILDISVSFGSTWLCPKLGKFPTQSVHAAFSRDGLVYPMDKPTCRLMKPARLKRLNDAKLPRGICRH